MSSKVGVLAHNQPATAKARTHLPRDVAAELVQRMGAERLTSKLIRMFPPDSVFPLLKPAIGAHYYVPAKLPPAELPGIYFSGPTPPWLAQSANVSFFRQMA